MTAIEHADRLWSLPAGAWIMAVEPADVQRSGQSFARLTVPIGTRARVKFAIGAGGLWCETEDALPIVIDRENAHQWEAAQ